MNHGQVLLSIAGALIALAFLLLHARRKWVGGTYDNDRCPHCAYDVGVLPVVRTICPECGGDRYEPAAIRRASGVVVKRVLLTGAFICIALAPLFFVQRDAREEAWGAYQQVHLNCVSDQTLVRDAFDGWYPSNHLKGELEARFSTRDIDSQSASRLRKLVLRAWVDASFPPHSSPWPAHSFRTHMMNAARAGAMSREELDLWEQLNGRPW